MLAGLSIILSVSLLVCTFIALQAWLEHLARDRMPPARSMNARRSNSRDPNGVIEMLGWAGPYGFPALPNMSYRRLLTRRSGADSQESNARADLTSRCR